MIDHVTLRVSNLERSKNFYEQAFSSLGWKIAFGQEGIFQAFEIGNGCLFEISHHPECQPITSTHIAFRVESPEKVQEFHRAAMDAGATDNGKPGPRPQYTENYYACFVLDPDGHNIEAMHDL